MVLFFCCFFQIQAQKNEPTNNKKVMKPKYKGEDDQEDISPNIILLEGKKVSKYRSKKDCNNNFVDFVDFKIERIIGQSRGIINNIRINTAQSFKISNNLKKEIKSLSFEKLVKILVTEELCFDNREKSYKILELNKKN